jgi:hypothetical protein
LWFNYIFIFFLDLNKNDIKINKYRENDKLMNKIKKTNTGDPVVALKEVGHVVETEARGPGEAGETVVTKVMAKCGHVPFPATRRVVPAAAVRHAVQEARVVAVLAARNNNKKD